MIDINWASFSRPQAEAVFDALRRVHIDVLDQVVIGRDNERLFDLATTLNQTMRGWNDDLARREHRLAQPDCDCGVCP